MRFYNREEELKVLRKNKERSKDNAVFMVIKGRRRIGKTALVRESEKNNRFLYFFVPKSNETLICDQLVAAAERDLGLSLFHAGRFQDLFKQLMVYGQSNNFTFMIDEFQELAKANGAIMSHIQNLWDTYKSTSKINLIVCGSVYSMMVKIFQNYNEPLFGRATSIMDINYFRPSVIKTILRDHNPKYLPDDLLFLYMVTGGVPKYIELFMDAGATNMKKMLDYICTKDSYFLKDAKEILITEFGNDHGTYFSILQAISNGKNTRREINDVTGKECGTYLDNLEKEYKMIRMNRPIFSKGNSRDVRWKVSDNYLRFYFRYINGNMTLIESNRYDILKETIKNDYQRYSGQVLEDYFKDKIAEEERFTEIGSYWDRKGENEIDIIVQNDLDKKTIVAEVKRNPKKASIDDLKKKAATTRGLDKYEIDYRILSLNDM